MIAKRIDHKASNNHFRALAIYVVDAKHDGEKVKFAWRAGCLAEDFHNTIIEVEATQAKNTRSRRTKTYHLMLSFRPEDESALTPETCRKLESRFAKALGLADHQRICALHRNTDHPHMHLVYNLIRPQNFRRVEPYRDFKILSQVCRAVEREYGLTVDRGLESDTPKRGPRRQGVLDAIEAHSGQETFRSYVLHRKDLLMNNLNEASSWRDLHTVFLQHGLHLKLSGNGLAIKDRAGRHHLKVSELDRSLCKTKLEKRFGPFVDASTDLLQTVKSDMSYSAAPLQSGGERDRLFQTFQEEMKKRHEALAEINESNRLAYEAIKGKWAARCSKFKHMPMMRSHRRLALDELKKRERDELAELKTRTAQERATVREARPYTSWKKYLQYQAATSNEKVWDIPTPVEKQGQTNSREAVRSSVPTEIFSRN